MRRLDPWATGLTAVTSILLATCTFSRSGVPMPGERCGDGVRQSSELCDGADLGGAGCTNLGFAGGTLGCTAACSYDTAGCTAPTTCGNGALDPGEACDDGNTVACDGCSPACRVETCGNGVRECAEACDDGNPATGDGCTPACTLEIPAQCGDGVLNAGEICEPDHVTVTCEDLNLGSGVVGCRADCLAYDTSGCRRPDGEACTENDQCAGGICFTEVSSGWPGGFCTRDCALATCETDFVCAVTNSGNFCYRECADPADCRPGYACFDNIHDTVTTVCRPHCETNGECPDTGDCNLHLGYCSLESGDGAYGAPCDDRYDCLGWCWTNASQDGYCFGLCELSSGVCPDGSGCVDYFQGTAADEGLCLATCESSYDCLQYDQSCYAYEGEPSVCWPPSSN